MNRKGHTCFVGGSICSILLAGAGIIGIRHATPNATVNQQNYTSFSRLKALPQTTGKLTYYKPRRGESLYSIARKFHVSLRSLSRANPRRKNNTPLLIPSLYFPPSGRSEELALNLAERILYLYDDNGQPKKTYPAAIGRVGWETPTGRYAIKGKTKNPTWFPPEWANLEEPVPPGPDNPLGDRWMGLSAPGYGIHATNQPASVGRAASHGCVRLYPEDARDLYTYVKRGMPVRIIYETILYGYSSAHKTVYLAVHPDIYNKGTNTLSRARAILDLAGLGDLIEDKQIQQMLDENSGVPTPLLGSTTQVMVNGNVLPLPFGPTPRDDDFLVPAFPLMAALGASVSHDLADGTYIFQRGQMQLLLSTQSTSAHANIKPVFLKGWGESGSDLLLVPLRDFCHALGVTVTYNRYENVIQVTVPSDFQIYSIF